MTGLVPDDALLDSLEGLAEGDPGQMLRACASAGAQVRSAVRASDGAGLDAVLADGRPRSLVVAGAAGFAGASLVAVSGPSCPVPVTTVQDLALPGWVGPLDVVVAVSCSGRTEEALVLAEEAARRGVRLVTVGAADSPLHRLSQQARGVHVAVQAGGRPSRANPWALSVPLLVLAHGLGLAAVPREDLDATADALDRLAEQFAPSVEVGSNPAKDLALALAGTLPLVCGTSPVTSAAAQRLAAQLAENAGMPALAGALPAAGHSVLEVLGGPLVETGGRGIFDDPFDSPAGLALRLLLVRDEAEHPRVTARAAAAAALADARGVPVTLLRASGATALQRLASLVALVDFATTYLALATGVDPTATRALDELQARTADVRS